MLILALVVGSALILAALLLVPALWLMRLVRLAPGDARCEMMACRLGDMRAPTPRFVPTDREG